MTVKRFFICLIYFMAAVGIFGILRFPHQAAARKITLAAQNMFPGIRITMDRVSLCFPPGLNMENTAVHLGNTLTLDPKNVRVHFPVSILLGLKKNINFSASLLEGYVNGHITDISLAENTYSGLQVVVTALQVRNLDIVLQGTAAQVSLDLSGRYHVPDQPEHSAGKGGLVMSKVTCATQDAFLNTMGITALDFNEITLAFTRNDKQILISDLLAAGDIINVTADGRLVFTGGSPAAPENWTIDLTGSLHPQPAYVSKFAGILAMENLFKTNPEKGIPFTMTGPAAALDIQL
ncbi:MAG: type II secretion system protein GspN [Desulfotignum sp.]|jgi:type II secretion system protein N|nr:type II secretion system protein GspN [Desulfotignum sp.]